MNKEELENYEPKGELIGFPKEIIARMLQHQEEQGNKKDISVFEEDRTSYDKGFLWNRTEEGSWFWDTVIDKRNFNLFFEKYPKKDNQYNSQEFNLENYVPKGELEGFPKEVIARMLDYQFEQGNERDISVFEKNIIAGKNTKGFGWFITKEGYDFWDEVIFNKDFNLFFEKYPKQGVCSECKECRKQEYQESKTAKYVQVGDNAILSDYTSTQSSVEINITEDNSQEFRVGDKVINIITGQIGVVSKINSHTNELVVLIGNINISNNLDGKFNNKYLSLLLNLDGKFNNKDKYPIFLHYRDDYDYSVIDFDNLPKRQEQKMWRAKEGGVYHFVNFLTKGWFFSDESSDDYDCPIDNNNYNSGNYFRTEVEAEIIAQKLNTYFKQLIKEEHDIHRN